MPLHFRCPCGMVLNSPDGSEGRAAECPTCGKIIVIPLEAVSLALADLEGPAPEARPPTEAESQVSPPPAAADVEIEPALEEDVPDPEEAFGRAAVPAPQKPPASWPLSAEEMKSEPTLIIGQSEPDAGASPEGTPQPDEGKQRREEEEPLVLSIGDHSAGAIEAAPLEGEEFAPVGPPEPPEPPEPPPIESHGPARRSPTRGTRRPATAIRLRHEAVTKQERPVSGRPAGAAAPGLPRSQTAVVRKRGRKALEALEAADRGEGAAKRRTRRAPPKRRGRGKKLLIFVMVVVLLGAGGFAALLLVPANVIPPQFRERVDSLRMRVLDLGLLVKLLKEPGDAGGETDADTEDPAESTERGAGE